MELRTKLASAVGALGLAAAAFYAPAASAGDVGFSFSVGGPGYAVSVGNYGYGGYYDYWRPAPVVVAPYTQYYYAPPRVIYQPYPVYRPYYRQHWRGHGYGHGHGHWRDAGHGGRHHPHGSWHHGGGHRHHRDR